MEDARGPSRSSIRLGNTGGSEAQQAAMYSFQAAQQLDLAPGYQKGKRPKLTSLSVKSINVKLTGSPFSTNDAPSLSPTGSLLNSCPSGVSPGPIPILSPRPLGTSSNIGRTTVSAPHLHLPNAAEFSRLEIDGGEPDKGSSVLDAKARYSHDQIILPPPCDFVGGHDGGLAGSTAPELPFLPAAAAPPLPMTAAAVVNGSAATNTAFGPDVYAAAVTTTGARISFTGATPPSSNNHRSPLRRSTLSPRTLTEEDVQQQQLLLAAGTRALTTSCEGSLEASMPLWPKVLLTNRNRPVGSSAVAVTTPAAGGDPLQAIKYNNIQCNTPLNNSSSSVNNNHNYYVSNFNKNIVSKTNRIYDGDEHQQQQEQQQQVVVPQPPLLPSGDIGSHGAVFHVRTPSNEGTPIISPSQRSFRHEKVRRHTSWDLPTQLLVSSSRIAPTPPRKPASAVWAGQPWAQDEDMIIQQQQQQQQTSPKQQTSPQQDLPQQALLPGVSNVIKSAAVMNTPAAAAADNITATAGPVVAGGMSRLAAAATGRIPQPSNLYGRVSSSTLLAKLPPSRVITRRGGLANPRSSSNGSLQDSTAQQLQLSPYTKAALTAGACGTGSLLLDADVEQGTHLSSSAPASPVRSQSPASAVLSFAGLPISPRIRASQATATTSVSSITVMEGVAVMPDSGSHSSIGAFNPSQQAASQPAAEVQFAAGYNPSIEQILLGSGAASSSLRSMANSSPPRPDSQLQQAFRNLCTASKTPRLAAREDVWELQAALLRQVSILASPPPELPPIQSPRSAGMQLLTAGVGAGAAGLRNNVGNIRHVSRQQPHAGAIIAASPSRGALAAAGENSRRLSTSPADISQRTTIDGGPYAEISTPTIINATTPTASLSRWGPQAAQSSPAAVLVCPPANVAPFTSEDVAFPPLLTRDEDGYVLESLIAGQESALSTALTGLVVQVGVSCVERAHLLHRLWATMRQLLAAVLQDRETARSQVAAASREAADYASRAAGEVGSLQQQLAALTQVVEKLTEKDREQTVQLAAANSELEHLRQVVADGDIESLSARLMDAEEGRSKAMVEAVRMQGHVKALEAEIYELRQEQAMAAARLNAFESHTCALTAELRCRTPRPSRSLGTLDELLAEDGNHKEVVLSALSAGANPLDLHRLMLGVTHDGEDLNPWVEVFGCVQSVVPPWSDAATHHAAMAPPQDAAVAEATSNTAAAVAATAAAAVAGSGSSSAAAGVSGGGTAVAASSLDFVPPGTAGNVSPPPSSTRGGASPSGASGTVATQQQIPPVVPAGGQVVPGGTPTAMRRGVSFSQRGAATAAALAAAVMTGARVTSRASSPDSEHLSPPVTDPLLTAGPAIGELAHQAAGGSTLLESSGGGWPAVRGIINAARHRRRSSAAGEPTGGGAESTARRQVMSPSQQQAYMTRLHSWLVSEMEEGDVASLRRIFPDKAVDAIGSGLQLGVSRGAMAAWLLGTLSPGGFNFMPYKDLVGLLSRQFQHTPLDLGGPITSGLELAALSTAQRIKVLEDKAQQLHREVVRLKRCLADRKRAERAQAQAEANAIERKAHDRPVHPVHTFLTTKWADFFDGLGCGAKVPKVLHAEGRVFNSRMEKVDAEKLVNSIWAAKADWQSRNSGGRMTLADFMTSYMQRRFVNPRTVTETAYTLIYTLGQHMYDPDCHLFIRVLLGEVDEGIRAEGEELQADLVHLFSCLDGVAHGRCTGYLSKRDMHTALKGFFPSKTRARFQEVQEALDADCPDSEAVMYRRLFDTDQDLNQGVFAETIRTQHLEERLEGLQAIEDALMEAVAKARVHHVPPSLLASVLKSVIPDCTEECVRQYLRLVYGSDAGIRAAEAAAPAANAASFRAAAHSINSSKGGSGSKGGGSAQRSRSPAAGHSRPGAAAGAVNAAGSGPIGAEGAAANSGSSPTGGGGGNENGNGKPEEQVVVPTAEAVIQLIRLAGWVPEFPSGILTSLVEAASIFPNGAGGYSSGGAGINGPKLVGSSGNPRAALKRMRYQQAMGALKEAWLREEQARIQHIVQLAHGGANCPPLMGPAAPEDSEPAPRVSNSSVASSVPISGQPIDDQTAPGPHATLAAAAAAVGVKISSLASLPTAADFVDSKEPDVAALEAARKVLTTQLLAATAAMSKNVDGISTASTAASAGICGAAAKPELSLHRLARANPTAVASGGGGGSASNPNAAGGAIPAGNTPSMSPAPACGAAAAAAATAIAALEEAGERLQRLRALGGAMAALAEDRNEAFTPGQVPDNNRNVNDEEPLDGTEIRNGRRRAAAAGGARTAKRGQWVG